MLNPSQHRWLTICVLYFASALNYLDRNVLSALAPTLLNEFHLNNEQFGYVTSAFSIAYAFSAPVLGLFIDRVGLRWGAAIIVGLWSLAGMSTGFVASLGGLMLCRAALGFAEAGGIPANGKGGALYLEPRNRALGLGISQVGLTLGSMAAPLLATWISARHGWRSAFVITGLLGFFWIPVWLWLSRNTLAVNSDTAAPRDPILPMLHDRRFLGLIAANMLSMTVYSLWLGPWSTLFFVNVFHLTQDQANLQFVWIAPIFATLGGLLGGWLALRFIRAGMHVITARLRISFGAAVFVLATAAAPFMPTPVWATVAICISLFSVTCLSVNYYTIPLDLFGAGRAAFSVAALTGSFGLMQAFVAPLIGRWSTDFGWGTVCLTLAALPLLSVGVLKLSLRQP
jgi:ACS family hexuronate transporter-like MFS transporter